MGKKVPNIKLRDARLHHSLTQEQLAARIGVAELSIGRWERGEAFPGAYARKKLCDLFGMSAEELGFTDEEQVPPSIDKAATATIETTGTEEIHEAPEDKDEETEEVDEAEEEPQQEYPADATIPTPPKEKSKRPFVFAGIGLIFLVIIVGVGVYIFYFSRPPVIKPGGGWISPVGKVVKSSLYFAAYAYPTHTGEPAIDHVNFTIYWQGVDPRQWVIACVSRKPFKKDAFSCTANLRALGVPPGEITISFDVYDREGNHNNAPNGLHRVTYTP